MNSTKNTENIPPRSSRESTRAASGASPVSTASGEKCASRDLTISLEDILSKTSDAVNGHHYHKVDDNSYIQQEL